MSEINFERSYSLGQEYESIKECAAKLIGDYLDEDLGGVNKGQTYTFYTAR